jgi:hypothetical protein
MIAFQNDQNIYDLQSGEEPRTLDEATKYQRFFLQVHNAVQGHRGYMATVLSLRERGLDWRGAVQDVRRLVRSCPICQKADVKDVANVAKPYVTAQSFEPMKRLSVDSVGPLHTSGDPLNYRHILVVLDTWTRWIELYPMVKN